MILIAAVANDMGMRYNKRRVSRDAVLFQRIASLAGNNLWTSVSSVSLFPHGANVFPDIADVPPGAYCFLEEPALFPDDSLIEGIILYRWNRGYPSDEKFSLDLSGYVLTSVSEFTGKAHEKITEEIYEKR